MNTKTKTDYHITLDQVKRQLNFDPDETVDEIYLNDLVKDSLDFIERKTGRDIAKTTNSLIEYDYTGDFIRVYESNYRSLTSIDYDGSSIDPANCKIQIFPDWFEITFPSSISCDKLTLAFETGYATANNLPPMLKRCILMKLTDLHDVERGSLTSDFNKLGPTFEDALYQFTNKRNVWESKGFVCLI
jgi:hypothetical protein